MITAPYGRDGKCPVTDCTEAVSMHAIFKWNGLYWETCLVCLYHAVILQQDHGATFIHSATDACFAWGRATFYPNFNFCLIDEEYRADEEKIVVGHEVKSPVKVSSPALSNHA